jgi:flavin reductase (DIM6/NTAB) family NADH-FMN oxidoreductase RutF
MEYTTVPYTSYLAETIAALAGPGVLLVTAGASGRPNAMVIGWGVIGTIWSKPIMTVMVRPSRFSYGLIEKSQAFTVCVPRPDQRGVVDYCGSHTGRDVDKFNELGLTALPSTRIAVPGIESCPLIYECQVVHSNDVLPPQLAADIQRDFYDRGDYHRVYYGEILALRALEASNAWSA